MIKELEYETPECWFKGQIEVTDHVVGGEKLYIIK